MADVSDECQALQTDEIEVLESIYPSLISLLPNPSNRPGRLLNISIPVVLPASLPTVLRQVSADGPSTVLPTLEIANLPPITVRLLLPPCYPLQQPPKVLSLRANLPDGDMRHHWLDRISLGKLSDRIQELWEEEQAIAGEGAGVIWRWWDWIGLGEFLTELEYIENNHLSLTVPPSIPPSTFHTMLKTYNAGQIHSSFEKTAFSCSICLENRKGKTCIKIAACGCIFCTPCLSSCWSLAIEEGTLENVSCPSVSCVKTRATQSAQAQDDFDAELVESVVGKELRDRWLELKEKRKAEIDPTYCICPRPTCQAAVPPPPLPTADDLVSSKSISSRAIRLSDISRSSPAKTVAPPSPPPTPPAAPSFPPDDRWARYRICPKCDFSFCLYCSATWHGPHTPCAFPQTSALVLEYLSYPENSPQRKLMEARRGRTNLERMVSKWREDEENRKWLESKTRPCSGCGVRVEKSHGCNHMTCGRCNAHFCYRCGDSISPQDPYAHYRRPGHACFEKLFDMEEIERFERETAAGIAGIQLGDDADDWREVRGIWEW